MHFFFKKTCLETVDPSVLAFPAESDFPFICQQIFISLLHSNALNYLLWQGKLCKETCSHLLNLKPGQEWAVSI